MSKEQDARVAELVFGFQQPKRMTYQEAGEEDKSGCTCFLIERQGWIADVDWGGADHDGRLGDPIPWQPLYEYTTDPAADYPVLEHIRATWPEHLLNAWAIEIGEMLRRVASDGENITDVMDLGICEEGFGLLLLYKPGFFSLAALAVIEKEQADGQG